MNHDRAKDALAYLVKLFPRWKTTDELNTLWVELFLRHREDTVGIVLKAHRMSRKGNDPNIGDVGQMLEAAARQHRIRTSTEPPKSEPVCPDELTASERAAWRLQYKRPEHPRHVAELERVAAGGMPEGECYAAVVRGEGFAGLSRSLAASVRGSGVKSRAQQERDAEQERQRIVRKLDELKRMDGRGTHA